MSNNKREEIREWFSTRQDLNVKLIEDELLSESIEKAGELIKDCFKKGGKLLIFGNGGSAAEAQHFAAELVGRFEKKRLALPAIALTTDTSIITAQANDDSFGTIFSRQIEALGREGDICLGMTTSDVVPGDPHSENILNAFKAASASKLKSIGLFSSKTKNLAEMVDVPIIVPSTQTALIQEAHLAVIHLLCRMIEREY